MGSLCESLPEWQIGVRVPGVSCQRQERECPYRVRCISIRSCLQSGMIRLSVGREGGGNDAHVPLSIDLCTFLMLRSRLRAWIQVSVMAGLIPPRSAAAAGLSEIVHSSAFCGLGTQGVSSIFARTALLRTGQARPHIASKPCGRGPSLPAT